MNVIKAIGNGKILGEYVYNAKGQRVIKKTGPASISSASDQNTVYHYDLAGRLIEETAANGKLLVDYVYLNGQPLAMIRKQGNNEEMFYYHNDHIGTPKVLTDKLKKIVWNLEFDPFGNEIEQKGRKGRYIRKVINNLRFPGQYYDKETGLHQNYFRDYDPARGAYPQPDPIGLDGGLNLYSYGNNPVKWMDPFGLYTIKKCTIEILFGHHGVIDQHISNETCSAGSVVSCWAGGGADDGVPKSAKDVGNPIPGRTAPGNTPLTIAEGEKIALNDFDAGLKHAQTLCSQPECNKCCDKITVKITCHFGMDIFGRISVGAGICGKNQIIQCRKQ